MVAHLDLGVRERVALQVAGKQAAVDLVLEQLLTVLIDVALLDHALVGAVVLARALQRGLWAEGRRLAEGSKGGWAAPSLTMLSYCSRGTSWLAQCNYTSQMQGLDEGPTPLIDRLCPHPETPPLLQARVCCPLPPPIFSLLSS